MSREELIDHDDSGTSNPALSATEHDPPRPPPSPRPALQPLRISTNSGLTYLPGDDAYIAANLALHTTTLSSPLGSPRPYSSRLAPRHPALRRATLLMRASRSAASLQHKTSPTAQVAAPWPAPPPSRSQSLNFQQPPEPSPPLPSPFPPRTLSYSSESGAAEMNPDGSLTPAGLSWRRLHVSRAKLKATATTSELLSGFAMVAMVELQINEDTKVPEWLFVLFSICTTVLVAVHIFALMISTYILPSIDAVSRLHSPGGGEAAELVAESPHERLRWFIELAWAFSTVLGLFLFLVEVAILCWVKFWDYSFAAALASTAIVVPALAVFVGFAVHFYHTLVVHKCEASDNDLKQLERIKQQLDAVKPGV